MPFDRVTQYGMDTMGRGAANMQALTRPFFGDESESVHETAGTDYDNMEAGADHPATAGNPVSFLLILLGLIVALFFVHKASPILARETFGVNWLSFFQVGVMATAFILLEKAIFGRFPVPGVTNAVAAI